MLDFELKVEMTSKYGDIVIMWFRKRFTNVMRNITLVCFQIASYLLQFEFNRILLIVKKDLSANIATARMSNLTTCGLEDVWEGNASDREYLICKLLHAKKNVQVGSHFKLTNGQKQKHETSFNRFVLLSDLGEETILARFTHT